MLKTLPVVMLAAGLLSAALGPAQAQTPASQSAPKAALSSNSTVGDLMADADAKAVLTANVPQVVANPQLTLGYGMKLREIQPFEPALTDAVLAKIDKDLADMQAKRGR